MAHMQRTLAVMLLAIFAAAAAPAPKAAPAKPAPPAPTAPPAPFRPSDPCGDKAKASQPFKRYDGAIIRVIDPVTLVVAVRKPPAGTESFPGCPAGKGCRAKVRLVNLDAPVDRGVAAKAQDALYKAVHGQQVILALSPVQGTPGITNALVYIGTRSINQQQLTGGFATYRVFGPAAVDDYVQCKLQRGEVQAQVASRGVWAKPKP